MRLIRRNKKDITYNKLLRGIDPVRTKEDEIYNKKNEFINRMYSLTFLFLVVILIIVLTWR